MKHLLTEEQQEIFLRRTMAVYSEFKKDFPMETGAYKSAMSDLCDSLIYVSSELTYDVSRLRNDIEEALELQDECDDEVDSESFVIEALPRTVVYTLQDGDIDPDTGDVYLEEDDE
jgi:hypothetical protein